MNSPVKSGAFLFIKSYTLYLLNFVKNKIMTTLYSAAWAQYGDYKTKLGTKKYRVSELAETITVKGASLVAMYCLSAMENNSANMTATLAELETLYAEDITAPSLIISGLETEAAGAYAVAVTAGVNTLTFPISLSTTAYSLFVTSLTSDGNFNSYKITGKLTTGFTITVAENGTIDYRAIIV